MFNDYNFDVENKLGTSANYSADSVKILYWFKHNYELVKNDIM